MLEDISKMEFALLVIGGGYFLGVISCISWQKNTEQETASVVGTAGLAISFFLTLIQGAFLVYLHSTIPDGSLFLTAVIYACAIVLGMISTVGMQGVCQGNHVPLYWE